MRALAGAALAALAVVGCSSSGTGSAHPSRPLPSPCVQPAPPSAARASLTPPERTDYGPTITAGQTIKQSVVAKPALHQFMVETFWSQGDVQLGLTSPSGKVYDRSTTDPSAHHNIQGKSETFALDHGLTEPGQWTIQLFGTGVPASGETVQITVIQIPLSNYAPAPYASGAPDRGVAPVTVQFDSTGSVAWNPAKIASYRWDFGDCSPVEAGPGPLHFYEFPGSYTVTLTVTDSFGETGSAITTIFLTATDQPPTARFAWASTDPSNPNLVEFDATQSGDVDGLIVNDVWDFGDGTSGRFEGIDHAYSKAGTYVVKLTVTDDGGLSGSNCELVTTGRGLGPPTPTPCPG
jgi:PKD repeat protein